MKDIKQIGEPQLAAYKPLSTADQYLGLRASEVVSTVHLIALKSYFGSSIYTQSSVIQDSNKGVIQGADSSGLLPGPTGPSDVVMGPSYASLMHPLMVCNLNLHRLCAF